MQADFKQKSSKALTLSTENIVFSELCARWSSSLKKDMSGNLVPVEKKKNKKLNVYGKNQRILTEIIEFQHFIRMFFLNHDAISTSSNQ